MYNCGKLVFKKLKRTLLLVIQLRYSCVIYSLQYITPSFNTSDDEFIFFILKDILQKSICKISTWRWVSSQYIKCFSMWSAMIPTFLNFCFENTVLMIKQRPLYDNTDDTEKKDQNLSLFITMVLTSNICNCICICFLDLMLTH